MWHRRLKKQWKSDGSLRATSVCMGWEYRQLKTRGLGDTIVKWDMTEGGGELREETGMQKHLRR